MLLPKLDIFVDGGGNYRTGIEKYLSNFDSFHKIYVFEPNPMFYQSYNGSNFELIKKAMWVHDGKLSFYLSKDGRQVGSSLLKNKLCRTKDGVLVHATHTNEGKKEYVGPDFYDAPIEVECVDFSNWLKTNINSKKHNLTLKLDIEGAEYNVLSKMIDDGTIDLVGKLYVEFHQQHLNVSQEDHDLLVNKIKSRGLTIHEWD